MRPIGYYVHHHGDGHRQRALAIAEYDPSRFMLFGTGLAGRTKDVASIVLPDDRITANGAFVGNDGEHERPQTLHYAPLHHDGVRIRMSVLANWIATARPALIVVDVSVEVAMLARLCATPVAYVRLNGKRDDPPHLEAFRAASMLIAPFAEALDDQQTADWIRRKTIFAPGIVPRRVSGASQFKLVLVVCGRGGSIVLESKLIEAALCTPDRQWRVIGMTSAATNLPPNLIFAGWVDDPEDEIARAEIVVGAAGDGLVGAVLAARRPFVCIPESRPLDEQLYKAAALQRMGAAIVLENWPEATRWNEILELAHNIDPETQAGLDDPDGVSRLSRRLIEFADRQK